MRVGSLCRDQKVGAGARYVENKESLTDVDAKTLWTAKQCENYLVWSKRLWLVTMGVMAILSGIHPIPASTSL